MELVNPVELATVQPLFVEAGVWIRPFGKLVYLMPPFIIQNDDLGELTRSIVDIVSNISS